MPVYTSPQDSGPAITTLYAATPYGNRGSTQDFFTGADSYIFRPLLRFDLSSIPAGSTCNSATLYIGIGNANDWNAARAHSVYAIRVSWTEGGARWDVRDGSTAWGSLGAGSSTLDYFPTPIATFNTPTSAGMFAISLDPTTVAGWFGGGNNNGFIVRNNDESDWTWKQFLSDDYSASIYRPYLVVDYSEGGGGGASATATAALGALGANSTVQAAARAAASAALGALGASATGRAAARASAAAALAGINSQATGQVLARAAGAAVLGALGEAALAQILARAVASRSLGALSGQAAAVGGLTPSSAVGAAALGRMAANATVAVAARAAVSGNLGTLGVDAAAQVAARAVGQVALGALEASSQAALGSLPAQAVGLAGLGVLEASAGAGVAITAQGDGGLLFEASATAQVMASVEGAAGLAGLTVVAMAVVYTTTITPAERVMRVALRARAVQAGQRERTVKVVVRDRSKED